MLLFTTSKKIHKLKFRPLANCMEHLSLAAKWAENEWGYIRNKGIEYRKDILNHINKEVYIGFYNNVPIAMFALLSNPTTNIAELMYVYVHPEYRSLGFGNQLIEFAKRLVQSQRREMILLDTLKPSLNRFYQAHGAKVVAQNTLYSHPTDVLRISF